MNKIIDLYFKVFDFIPEAINAIVTFLTSTLSNLLPANISYPEIIAPIMESTVLEWMFLSIGVWGVITLIKWIVGVVT